MSTILAYTSPARGHLFPMTPLLLELRDRGHRVHVRTLGSETDLMRSLGLAAEAIDPRIEAMPMNDYAARGPKRALAAAAEVFAARGGYDAPDLSAAIAEVRPHACIVDINSWGAGFAAEAWGGPWASFSPYTPALDSPGTPPFGPGLPPMRGFLGKARDALAPGIPDGLQVPANATVKEFVPHSAVLGRAAVAVTHGGMGATQKALANGVPVCVVPFGRDQLEVARRVEVSGAGTRLPARRLSAARLKRAVKAAMAMKEGANRVAAGYKAAGGAPAAADAIEARLLSLPQHRRET
ncbi:glycosyltransferase [Pseudarthrobacter sp. NPDC055928]|uniref:glycosyltransferase n=1 Tax=Pseudarthrobacter sp. NPDC055928 TaxID=3345661 RepID=UPI0035DCBDAC